MREIRLSGSEGGAVGRPFLPLSTLCPQTTARASRPADVERWASRPPMNAGTCNAPQRQCRRLDGDDCTINDGRGDWSGGRPDRLQGPAFSLDACTP